MSSVRLGDWKLTKFYETGEVKLFNLMDDIGEEIDLSKKNPDKAKELEEAADGAPQGDRRADGDAEPGLQISPAGDKSRQKRAFADFAAGCRVAAVSPFSIQDGCKRSGAVQPQV
ncbi:MAG: hypothetical protein R2724_11395 [Bryobacterales bacterium]